MQPRTRGRGGIAPALSPKWAVFDGVSTKAELNSIADQLHAVNGDFWYAFLLKVSTGGLLYLHDSAGGPTTAGRIEIYDKTGDQAHYRTLQANWVLAAAHDTTQDVFDDAVHLVVWQTKDEGTNAGVYSQVDGNATVYHGAGSELRQGMGDPWPPDLLSIGDTAGVAGPLTGKIGWMAFGKGTPLDGSGGSDIWTAYNGAATVDKGRRALAAAITTAAGQDPKFAGVLDGETSPAYGPAVTWTAVTYAAP